LHSSELLTIMEWTCAFYTAVTQDSTPWPQIEPEEQRRLRYRVITWKPWSQGSCEIQGQGYFPRVQRYTHRYTGTQVHRYTGTQVHRYTGTHTGTQVHRYTGTQVHRYTGTQVHRYIGTQVHRYTGTQVHRYMQLFQRSQ
jgi:hypothetical protein